MILPASFENEWIQQISKTIGKRGDPKLIEKLRSVMQRMQARDLYDIWYLLEIHGMEADFYLKEYSDKCINKGLNPGDFQKKLEERLPQYKGRWKSSLSEQIKDLPGYEQVERETLRHLKKLKFQPAK